MIYYRILAHNSLPIANASLDKQAHQATRLGLCLCYCHANSIILCLFLGLLNGVLDTDFEFINAHLFHSIAKPRQEFRPHRNKPLAISLGGVSN